jgi:hypothetical protein
MTLNMVDCIRKKNQMILETCFIRQDMLNEICYYIVDPISLICY